MKPTMPPNPTTVLLLKDNDTGAEIQGRRLHGQHVDTLDGPAIMTVWEADVGERVAIMNGAPIELLIFGPHPAVSLAVGQPDENAVPMIGVDHVERALGHLYGALVHTAGGDPEETPLVLDSGEFDGETVTVTIEAFANLFATALEETRIKADVGLDRNANEPPA